MIKIITLLAAFTMSASPAITLYNQNTEIASIENGHIWNDVGIKSNSVETDKTGTNNKESVETISYATAKLNWDSVLMHTNYVIAKGYFALHTYTEPKFLDEVTLNLDKNKSKDNELIWVSDDETYTNNSWTGWGHHTSMFRITLKAEYNVNEGIVSLDLNTYVYARTAGSVHSCSTTVNIDSIDFLVE